MEADSLDKDEKATRRLEAMPITGEVLLDSPLPFQQDSTRPTQHL